MTATKTFLKLGCEAKGGGESSEHLKPSTQIHTDPKAKHCEESQRILGWPNWSLQIVW